MKKRFRWNCALWVAAFWAAGIIGSGNLIAGSNAAATRTGAATRGAQLPTVEQPRKLLLWEHGAPGAMGTAESDQPSLEYFPPWGNNPSRTCVIVAPGGSYVFLASNH